MKKKETKKPTKKITSKTVKKVEKPIKTSSKKEKKGTDEITKLIQTMLVILVIFSGFYLFTYFLKENKSYTFDNSNKTPAVIQYDEIVAGTVLSQNSENYYVLIQGVDDETEYQSLMNIYYQMNKDAKLYYVNMDSIFNEKYMSEESNLMIENINDLRISDTAIIHVLNGKVISQKSGSKEVYTKLLTMTEER